MGLKERWLRTCEQVADLCALARRDSTEVRIVAVSKTVGPEVVGQAIECGMADFGENREKPFNEKAGLFPQARWHFIGTLQSNKAKQVVGTADLIHSVDRPSLVAAIQKAAEKAGIVQDILIEVSISGEESKGGVSPADLPALIEQVAASSNIACKGFMTMAPRGDIDIARRTFSGLRELAAEMDARYSGHDGISLHELSMGMSEDYPAAIAEGATMVRIGRKIFSEEFETL